MIKTRLHRDEKGFAALVVAMTLVLVLSLLTIGFAQIIRNESRQALNRQLSSQAYYAAEAGINDAVRAIKEGYSKRKTTCGPITAPAGLPDKYLMDNTVNAAANTKWTCLLIDTAPTSVDYGSIDTVTPTVFTVTGVDAATNPVGVTSITVAWQDADSSLKNFRSASGVATNTSFPPKALWNAVGVLRLAVTPFSSFTPTIDRGSLIKDTFTAFLYPNSASPGFPGTTTYTNDQTKSGPIVNGNCNTANATTYARFCVVKISFPGVGMPRGTKFLFNLRSVYSSTNAHITANGGAARLVGAQTVIDSTGQSQDVLKRIQVRIPTNDSQLYPGFGLDSIQGVCKTLSVYPGSATGLCP